MTELACCQIGDPAAAPISTLFDQQRQHHQSFMGDMSAAKNRTEEPFSLDSRSDSTPSRRPNIRYWNSHSGAPHRPREMFLLVSIIGLVRLNFIGMAR